MRQPSASAARVPSSTARRFSTGKAPGRPRHTGQTWVFGAAPKLVGQPQNIFVSVRSCAWNSSPMTASNANDHARASGARAGGGDLQANLRVDVGEVFGDH